MRGIKTLKKALPGKPDCYFIGLNVVDALAFTALPFEEDKKIRAEHIMVDGGGPAATAACAAARAGLKSAVVTLLGHDEWTGFALSSFRSFGVDTRFAIISDKYKTPLSLIIVNSKNASRTIVWNSQGINDIELPLAPAEFADIASAPLLHFDGHMMNFAEKIAPVARAKGALISYDCGSPKEGWQRLAGHTDFFIASHALAEQLDRPVEKLVEELKDRHGFQIAVTAGEKGYYYFDDGKGAVVFVPQKRFAAVDTTGCGDVFHGAFLAGYKKFGAFRPALDFAQEFAGRKALKRGGRAALKE
ncbi:MAG: PfkB family carbohydrate kinase [Elusimicrobiaceae bacterium]